MGLGLAENKATQSRFGGTWYLLHTITRAFFIGASVRRSSGRRSTAGNDVVATIFIRLFFFFPLFFPVFFFLFFSPSRPFLIEGVLGSKNLFSES